MRFISEFELNVLNSDDVIDTYKGRHSLDLGNNISEAFSWKKNEKGMHDKYSLEVEAFPMEKWMLFKTKLFHRLIQDNIPTQYFDRLIEELESFGKPEGDKI